jgi:hypothetical protein
MGNSHLMALHQLATILGTTRLRVHTALPDPKKPAASISSPLPLQKTPETPLAQLFEALEHVISVPDHWYANAIINPDTGISMEYRELITNPTATAVWSLSTANEFGRLPQGVGGHILTLSLSFVTLKYHTTKL